MDRRLIDPGTLEGIDAAYLPEAGRTFELPSFWVDAERVHVFGASKALPVVRRRRVLFFVHPAALRAYRPWLKGCAPGPVFHARATSSTRTVYVLEPGVCLKLSLPMVFAGERRDIRNITLSPRRGEGRGEGLRIVPETCGVVPKDEAYGGYVIREMPRGVRLTPWFALKKTEQHLRGFLRAWMRSALDEGWVADVHAQNVLVGGGRYWVRDMDSVWLDDPELEGARTSLHTYFLGGPARKHRALFFRELARYAGKAARDPEQFSQWLEDERWKRRRTPRSPASVRRWLKREQTQNPRRRDPRRFAKVSLDVLPQRFRPENQPVWRLPYFVAPLARVRVHGAARPSSLFTAKGVRMFFHPAMEEHYALDVQEYGRGTEEFWATPTASPRSVVAWSARHAPFGLKLSLDVELLGLSRLVEESKLVRAVAVSSVLRGVRVLREPVAVRTEEKDYGFIYRALEPNMNALRPGFSVKAGERELTSLVRTFAALAFGQGLIGDLHQQNVLFTRSGDVVLRDLDSFKCDGELRRLRELPVPAGLKLDARAYQRAWADELRGEWLYLARGKSAFLDEALLEEAARWLGRDVVDAERAELRRRGWKKLSHRGEPLYSVEAMVHAWKQKRVPSPLAGRGTG